MSEFQDLEHNDPNEDLMEALEWAESHVHLIQSPSFTMQGAKWFVAYDRYCYAIGKSLTDALVEAWKHRLPTTQLP